MSENVRKVASRTGIVMETCNFTWSIENFSVICSIKTKNKEYLSSSTFTTGKSSLTEWCVRIKFHDNESFIGIFLKRTSSEVSTHYVSDSFSIIGSDTTKHYARNESGNVYDNNNSSWGYLKFIDRKTLLVEKKDLLLPNDTLTVMIDLKVSNVDDIYSKLTEETETIPLSAPIVLKETDCLIGDLQHLYENEIFSDFSVKVGEEEFKVHKLILSTRSSVFNSMLNCDMKENIANCLEITDFDPPVVKTMLRYIYCGQVEDLTPEMCTQLFSIADKYNLQGLKNMCSKYLLQNLNVGNICAVLILAEMHDEQELMEAAKRIFCANAAAIQETEPWIELSEIMPQLANSMYHQLVVSQKET